MKNILEKLKKRLGFIIGFALACTVFSVGAFAAAETDSNSALAGVSDQIIDQFQTAANNITPIIVGILGAGLGIFVIFICIKLGKKMFKTVSNG